MLNSNQSPRLIFQYGFNEHDADEAEARGYLSHVAVDLGDGRHYPVVFYDAVRLQQDLEVEAKQGTPYVADPGMIVLETVTRKHGKGRTRSFARRILLASGAAGC